MLEGEVRSAERGIFDSLRSFAWFSIGAFIGATYTYYFDSTQGRRRRKELAERGQKMGRQAGVYSGKVARDLLHRGQGLIAKSLSPKKYTKVDDETLRNRVRSEFGHVITHASSIDVQASDGDVTLSGPILTSEVEDLIHCVRNVPGVRHVINQLDTFQKSSDIPVSQGKGRSSKEIPFLQ